MSINRNVKKGKKENSTGCCLNERGSHWHICLNAWSLACGTVLGSIRRCSLIGRDMSLGVGLEVLKVHTRPNLSFSCFWMRCNSLGTAATISLPITILPTKIDTFWNSLQGPSYVLSFISCLDYGVSSQELKKQLRHST